MALGTLLKGPRYNRAAYMELLGVLFALFKLAKSKGDLALESHVENPDESSIETGDLLPGLEEIRRRRRFE